MSAAGDKPANILVDAAGEPKLLDFSIATLLDDSGPEQTRTAWRAMTTRYAAPEQVAGDRTTTATDAYALGVLLFELVGGHSPRASAEAGSVQWSAAVLREAPRVRRNEFKPSLRRGRAASWSWPR